MNPLYTRRQVAFGLGAFALTGCRTSESNNLATSNLAQLGVDYRLRRNVWDLDPNGPELNDYRKAIKAMQALPIKDPRSWDGQASIHLNSCPHNNWFFVTWHRAYLFYFEKLIQQYSGNPKFALPYWDWSMKPEIPPAFLDKRPGNPLFIEGRAAVGQLPSNKVSTPVIEKILKLKDFVAFAGARSSEQRAPAGSGGLESTPHNAVHNWVGGEMGTFKSPLDPIFWLHHANIDRLWAEWASKNPTASLPANPAAKGGDDPKLTRDFWLNFTLAGFADVKGLSVTAKAADLLETTSYKYMYDTLATAARGPIQGMARTSNSIPPTELRESASQMTMSSGQTKSKEYVSIKIPISAEIAEAHRKIVVSSDDVIGAHVRLYVSNLPIPDDFSQVVRVFLNHPEPTISTSEDDSHFVGTYSFFGAAHKEHGGEKRIALFSLNEAFRGQSTKALAMGGYLNFQLQLLGAKELKTYFDGVELKIQVVQVD